MDSAAYQRRRRAEHPDLYEREKAVNRAINRALRRLAHLHRDEYIAIVNEEREREGLPPLGASLIGRPPKTE